MEIVLDLLREIEATPKAEVSLQEFSDAFTKSKLNVSKEEIRRLFQILDTTNQKLISKNEFTSYLKYPLSVKRRELLTDIFVGLEEEAEKSGKVATDKLVGRIPTALSLLKQSSLP